MRLRRTAPGSVADQLDQGTALVQQANGLLRGGDMLAFLCLKGGRFTRLPARYIAEGGGRARARMGAGGVVTFTVPPASGAALTWTGGYYRRVRFDMDEMDFQRIMNLVWGAGQNSQTINLISVK